MSLCCKVYDCPRPMFGQKRGDAVLIRNIATDENVASVFRHRLQITEIAGIRELVDIDDRFIACSEPVEHEVRADKTGSAGDK